MNQVTLIGNVATDPKPISETGVSFRVATTEKSRDGTPRTEFHDVVAFGIAAEKALAAPRKGARVAVQGKLQTRKFQKQDGATAYATSVLAFEVLFDASKTPSTPTPEAPESEDLPF